MSHTVLPFGDFRCREMEVVLRHWRDLTKICLHPGADHGELEVLKDELQVYEGNCLSPDLGEGNRNQWHTGVESHDLKAPRQIQMR